MRSASVVTVGVRPRGGERVGEAAKKTLSDVGSSSGTRADGSV